MQYHIHTYSDDGIPHVMVDKREAFFFTIIYTQVTIGSICVAAVHRQQIPISTVLVLLKIFIVIPMKTYIQFNPDKI